MCVCGEFTKWQTLELSFRSQKTLKLYGFFRNKKKSKFSHFRNFMWIWAHDSFRIINFQTWQDYHSRELSSSTTLEDHKEERNFGGKQKLGQPPESISSLIFRSGLRSYPGSEPEVDSRAKVKQSFPLISNLELQANSFELRSFRWYYFEFCSICPCFETSLCELCGNHCT